MREQYEIHAPYVGLRPFESHEASIFFGREAHVSRLLEILNRERFLAVIGTSGSGKSSLIRAGMLPALAMGWTGDVSDWRIAVMRPGDRPMRRLAEALLAPSALAEELDIADGSTTEARGEDKTSATSNVLPLIEAELRRGPLGLIHLFGDAQRIATERSKFNLLVLVDQFEEIFRYAEMGADQANESEAFVNAILQPRLEKSDAAMRIYVALTMRTDALNECARFLDLPEAINRAQYLTPRLRPDELHRAITEPARVFEGKVEPEVTTLLVNSVIHAQDQLPILQHALARMWESAAQRDRRHPLIDESDVERTGGIQKALSRHADSVFDQLSPIEQMYADVLFRAITDAPEGGIGDARRPQRLSAIARFAGRKADQWDVFLPAMHAFAREGVNFLTFSWPIDGSTVVDISHEALIRHWDRLGDLVALEAEQASAYRRWRNRSDDYWNQGAELLAGADLAAALRWRDGAMTGNPLLDKYVAVDRSSPLGRPAATWAERYSRARTPEGAKTEFERVQRFIELSEDKDRKRTEDDRRADEEQQAAKDHAAALGLAAERARGDAAAREQAIAEEGARKSRKLARVAALIAAIAVVTAGLAVYYGARASESAARASESAARAQASFLEATSTRLAAEGQAMVAGVRPGGTIRGVLELLAAHRIQSGVEPYFALQSGANRLDRVIRLIDAQSEILCVAFSPDGKRIVSGGRDETLRLWDADKGIALGEPLRGHDGMVFSVAFSPDGKRIVSGGADYTLRLWDADKGIALGEPLRGHDGPVLTVAFSPDGKSIVSGGRDNTLRLWEADKGIARGEPLRGHNDAVRSVGFSPDGKRIVSGSLDRTLRLWDADRGIGLGKPLRGHDGPVLSVAFSPDGKRIVSGSRDKTLRLWRADKGIALGSPLYGHGGPVLSVAFSPDGRRIASGSEDKTLFLWRLWNPDWGIAHGEPLRGHTDAVWSVAFSPDGKRIVSGSEDKTMALWDGYAGTLLSGPLRRHTDAVWSVAFSFDGKRIVSGSEDNMLRLWDAAKGLALGEPLRGHDRTVLSVAFSPDGKRMVSGSEDTTLRLWDTDKGIATGEPLRGHDGMVWSVAFSPDGKRIVSGSEDKTLRLWDANKGIALGEPLRAHTDAVRSVAFSPDGERIVSGSQDKTLRLWDADKGIALGEPLRGHTGEVGSVAFSPDGKRIVSGSWDKTLRLWDANKGVALAETLRGHDGAVLSVAFSPDGKRIVSGSGDKTLRLWDVDKGIALGEPLRGHTGEVSSVAFSPDGKGVVSGSEDKTVRVWPVLDGWADVLCAKLMRNMAFNESQNWVGDIPYIRQCPDLPMPEANAATSTQPNVPKR